MIKPFKINEEIRFNTHIVWVILDENDQSTNFHTRKEAVEFYNTLNMDKANIYELNISVSDLSLHRDVQSLNQPLL